MDREKKLELSTDPDHIYAFRQGLFAKLFEQSLYRFILQVRPLKPMTERSKNKLSVIYGGLPIKSFEALVNEGCLTDIETLEDYWCWSYKSQSSPEEERAAYEKWRYEAISETKGPSCNLDVLTELAAFNLGSHTPVEIMNQVLEWQKLLKNREGVG